MFGSAFGILYTAAAGEYPVAKSVAQDTMGLTEIAVRPGSVSERDGFAWADLAAEANCAEAWSA